MKDKLIEIYKKHRKFINIAGIGLGLIILGLLSWKLVFVKYKIFYQEEKQFTDAVKRYYEYHSKFLPRDGESKDITLQEAYDLDILDDLYIPKTRKTCNPDSWVRVFKNDKGEYKYITYLKCGRYSSRVDHTGPEIVLKGGLSVSVALNSEYKDLGIVSVKDNKDGSMNVKDVEIDASKVDTKNIGEYPVTYTIKDSNRNKTVVTRTVEVVQGLTDTVKANVASDGFYKKATNNYVIFSGMLWKIMNVNSDGTVKIVLNQPLANLRFNHKEYKNSNVDLWLKNEFYSALKYNGATKYLVKSKYCVGDINSMNDYSSYCSTTVERYVGLVDINEYYKSFENGSSAILSKSFALGHKIGDNYADATYDDSNSSGTTSAVLAPIRPTVTLKNTMKIMYGDGSYINPYKLDDYSYPEKKTKINTRMIGEYLVYSGITFRIIGIDDNQNVRVIMDRQWKIQPDDKTVFVDTKNIDKWNFNPKDEDSIAYTINNDFLDYIDTKYVVDTEYEVPTNDPSKLYTKYKTKKVKAKIVLPKTYELFSASDMASQMYLYIDKATNNQIVYSLNCFTSKVYEFNKEDYSSFGVKAILTLKGDLKIEGGSGLAIAPYRLSK